MGSHYAVELMRAADGPWERREALVHGARRWTYGQLARTVRGIAAVLRSSPGARDGVAVLADNRPEVIAVQFAAHLLGYQVALLAPGSTYAEREELLRHSGTGALVSAPAHAASARALAATTGIGELLSLGPAPSCRDLVAEAAARPAEPALPAAPAERVRTLLCTGGTTGLPKGVVHTHGLYDALAALVGAHGLALPGERRLVCTPLSHVSGHFALPTLLSGGTLVLHDGCDPGAVLETIASERINALVLTSPLMYQVLDHPALSVTDHSTLRCLGYGAALTPLRRQRQALDRLGPVLQHIYGLTEAGVVTLLQPGDHHADRPESLAGAGRPVPGMRVEVRDDAGRRLPAGRAGEVWVRGPSVMAGYLGHPAATEEAIRDGWLRTGDIGSVDASGALFLRARKNEVIMLASGARVYPRVVEEALLSHPAVRAAAVIGVPDGADGERVHATVVPHPGRALDPAALRAHVRAELGQDSMVPESVATVARLPMTRTGKVDRTALKDLRASDGN
ncbi:class I adenylate-forming enzyme family protein [Streptomyces sp. NPDC018045]|uniref:class I adenylate-forming enzyme family protein n=1 Tax=Streptomyces sp. NPDC018045 TaxID=3365037 RepID=UPI00379D333B